MKQELEDILYERYPRLFKERGNPNGRNTMYGGFCHGDGWFNILNALCHSIQSHVSWKRECRAKELLHNRRLNKALAANDFTLLIDPKLANHAWHVERCREDFITQNFKEVTPKVDWVEVDQIKEKFGTLRFYCHGGDSATEGMIRMAEQMSVVTCELCGNPGKHRGGGWIQTLCDEHAKQREDELGKESSET